MKNETTTFTIEMTAEMMLKFNALKETRQGRSDAELLNQVLERGLYDLNYRTKRNKQVWSEFKEYRASKKSDN